MRMPLLLHALSLNDRILEPHSLPLHGRVWAYAKEDCSRDGIIGHCLTMLSQFGLTACGISLGEKNIVAFDAQGAGRTYTVVISLADDFLASRYFYFLGIWRHMDVFGKAAALPDLLEGSNVLQAEFQYRCCILVCWHSSRGCWTVLAKACRAWTGETLDAIGTQTM